MSVGEKSIKMRNVAAMNVLGLKSQSSSHFWGWPVAPIWFGESRAGCGKLQETIVISSLAQP